MVGLPVLVLARFARPLHDLAQELHGLADEGRDGLLVPGSETLNILEALQQEVDHLLVDLLVRADGPDELRGPRHESQHRRVVAQLRDGVLDVLVQQPCGDGAHQRGSHGNGLQHLDVPLQVAGGDLLDLLDEGRDLVGVRCARGQREHETTGHLDGGVDVAATGGDGGVQLDVLREEREAAVAGVVAAEEELHPQPGLVDGAVHRGVRHHGAREVGSHAQHGVDELLAGQQRQRLTDERVSLRQVAGREGLHCHAEVVGGREAALFGGVHRERQRGDCRPGVLALLTVGGLLMGQRSADLLCGRRHSTADKTLGEGGESLGVADLGIADVHRNPSCWGYAIYVYSIHLIQMQFVWYNSSIMPAQKNEKMEALVSLAKRRGFIYQGSEVYGGLSGTWDYGPLGVALKRNIMQLWWKHFVDAREDMYGIDAAILMNQKVWQASGHVDTFVDPLCEDVVNKRRFRTDHILKDKGIDSTGMTMEQMDAAIKENHIKSPDGNELSESRTFNMMFKTHVGATTDEGAVSYLRPETAQGIFTNFKNVVDTFYPDLPFGLAQQGKAFRNEISPRDFIFRTREFEQMEIEYFVNPNDWEASFDALLKDIYDFLGQLGLPKEMIHELEVDEKDRAHYSRRTVDIEFDFPIGREELLGLAYRTDFDLMNIQRVSGKSMEYTVKGSNEKFVPHVIEPSFGVERALMAVLSAAYTEDEVNGEKRLFLRLPEHLAPVKYAVSPLLKNKPELIKKARDVYRELKKKHGNVMWDDNGNIGKRYRRQDEIGTPYCVVIDFDTLEDDTITIRDRDTTDQRRISIAKLLA